MSLLATCELLPGSHGKYYLSIVRTGHSILIAFLLLCGSVSAQDQPKADSLKSLLRTDIADTTRLNILNALGWQLKYTNPDTAILLSTEALELAEKNGDKKGISNSNGNLGAYNYLKGDYPKALDFYRAALKIDEGLKNKKGIARHLSNIGLVYSNQGDYPKALEHYFKALKIDEELGNKKGIAIRLGYIGSLYTKTGKFKEAEQYLLQALGLCDSIRALNYTMHYEKNISQLYDTTGRYQLALEHYKKYSTAKDSLFNEEKAKDLGKLEAKHEFETAEAERKRLEEEQAKQAAAEKSRRDNLQYSGILIMLVLVFSGVFMLGRFNIPVRLAEGMIFFAFLLFFEFMLVMLDPYIENYSGGEPAYKLLFNAVLAGLIFPLHSLFESKMKGRLVQAK